MSILTVLHNHRNTVIFKVVLLLFIIALVLSFLHSNIKSYFKTSRISCTFSREKQKNDKHSNLIILSKLKLKYGPNTFL